MKYYWFSFRSMYREHQIYGDLICKDIHPFEYISTMKDSWGERYQQATLLNWKEITEEEFELFRKLKVS